MNVQRVLLVTLGVLLAAAGIILATFGYTSGDRISEVLGIGPCCPEGVAACCPADAEACCPGDAEPCCPECCPEDPGTAQQREVANGS